MNSELRIAGVVAGFLLLFAAIWAPAAVINIPDDHATIQAGVDASAAGDTILVWPGVYIENVSITEHSLILGSLFLTTGDTSYISTTIIDGDSLNTVIWLRVFGINDSISAITGFTIRNGNSHYGGGGINCNGSPTISHNVIRDNRTTRGGGIYLAGSPVIENNVIRDNHVTVAGGGIVSYGGSATIRNNMILNNTSDRYGGGIHIEDSEMVTVDNNIITGNWAGHQGGGLVFYAEGLGGFVLNNLIAQNISPLNAGIGFNWGTFQLANNTIADNSYNENGIQFWDHCDAVMVNNIIWNNGDNELALGQHCDVSIHYSDIQGGFNGEGNIDAAPLFCDPETGDYTLAENSPCAGTGFEGANMGAFGIGCEATDIDGNIGQLPTAFRLYQNYPNPFNATTTITFHVPESRLVTLKIYDILGRQIATLADGLQSAGYNHVLWQADDVSSGVYFYTIRAEGLSESKSMLLIK